MIKRLQIQLPCEKKLKTLVLDLDETLIHSSFNEEHYDFSFTIQLHGEDQELRVNKRPELELFIQELSKYYEIVIFTASIQEYAEKVIEKLQLKKYISKILSRNECIFIKESNLYLKDLRIFKGKKLKDIIIIDNNENSFFKQPDNGIQIKTYIDDKNDRELRKYFEILVFLSQVYDVRIMRYYMKFFEGQTNFQYIDAYKQKRFCIFHEHSQESEQISTLSSDQSQKIQVDMSKLELNEPINYNMQETDASDHKRSKRDKSQIDLTPKKQKEINVQSIDDEGSSNSNSEKYEEPELPKKINKKVSLKKLALENSTRKYSCNEENQKIKENFFSQSRNNFPNCINVY